MESSKIGGRPFNSLTTTHKGIYTMDEIMDTHPAGFEWNTFKGFAKAIQKQNVLKPIFKTRLCGCSRLIKFTFNNGMYIESAPDHFWYVSARVLERKGNGNFEKIENVGEWIRADRIQKNDMIEFNPGLYQNIEHRPLKRLVEDLYKQRGLDVIRQPFAVTEDLAWLIGYFWHPGTVLKDNRIQYTDTHRPSMEKAQSLLVNVFGLKSILDVDEKKQEYILTFGSEMFERWMYLNGFRPDLGMNPRGYDVSPRFIRSSSQSDVISFIAGVYDSPHVLTRRNNDFKNHLLNVIMAVGIGSYLQNDYRTLKRIATFRCNVGLFAIDGVDSYPFRVLFHNSVRISESKHSNELIIRGDRVRERLGKVRKIEYGECEVPTFNIEVEKGHFYSGVVMGKGN